MSNCLKHTGIYIIDLVYERIIVNVHKRWIFYTRTTKTSAGLRNEIDRDEMILH